MRNLPELVRLKAIEISNALLREGMEEGKAIRVGIGSARRWADGTVRQRRSEASALAKAAWIYRTKHPSYAAEAAGE